MKVKRTGRNIVLIAIVTTILYASIAAMPNINLSLTDMNGIPLTHVTTGVPFKAQVVIRDANEKFSAPEIPGIQHFARGGTSSSTQYAMMNGKTSTERSFSYVLRADHPGTFTLGPARIYHNNAVMESNELKIEVGAIPQTTSTEVAGQPAFLKVAVDKKEVVVGEPIWLAITLLHEPDVRLHSPLVFDLEKEGFELGQQLSPKTEQVMVNGKRYISIEQKMELYAYQNGSHVIPAITAQCKVPSKRNKRHPQFDFDDFFGRRFELYQVYSTPQSVAIQDLPPFGKDVAIVGEFNSFSAHLDHKKAKVGEGNVLRLVVEGSGNAKKVSFPKLIVPSELNAYESKFDLEEYNGSWRKTFEYVVQGNTKGSYTIPAQQFTYFDLKKRDYSTLSTRPLSITITEGEILDKSSNRTRKKSPEELPPATKEVKEEPNKIALLNESATIFDTIPMIPMKYFYQLRFLLIMLALGIPKLMSWYRGSPQKRACRKARSLLSQYKKDGDVTKLYQLLFNLFAVHAGSNTVVNEQGVVTYLQAKGADADLLQRDLNQLAEASFTAYKVEDKNKLFAVVDRWIAEVEKW